MQGHLYSITDQQPSHYCWFCFLEELKISPVRASHMTLVQLIKQFLMQF